ncbi:MAG TPA: type II secretion system F family protein [Micropepsaceae bacterium]|jgi:tight adherence protein C|nr:type II secretion system F family protein [Micropepsaceae bacterium]
MVLALFESLPAVTGVLILVAAVALVVGGAALIAYGSGMSREGLARRLKLIQPLGREPALMGEKTSAGKLVRIRLEGPAERDRSEILRRLGTVGIPENQADNFYLALRLCSVLVMGGIFSFGLPYFPAFADYSYLTVLLAIGAAIGGWFIPAMTVRILVNRHIRSVVRGLPDALELMVICVEAGLSLEDSLNRISKELKVSQPALAEELELTSADLKILPSRDQAFAHLANRINVPNMRSLVTTLSQTMRFGTPLAQALRTVASEMRNDSLIAMEDRANRLPALLTVPMMLFIMPTIFLIVGGPAALRVMDTLLK